MYNPEVRLSWDKGIKGLEIVDKADNEFCYISHTTIPSPMFLVSERDLVEKKMIFTRDGICYNFATSVEDSFIESSKDVVRCTTLLGLTVLVEDEDCFYFMCFSQCDVKVKHMLMFLLDDAAS